MSSLLDLELQRISKIHLSFESLCRIIAIHDNNAAAATTERVESLGPYSLNGDEQPPGALQLLFDLALKAMKRGKWTS